MLLALFYSLLRLILDLLLVRSRSEASLQSEARTSAWSLSSGWRRTSWRSSRKRTKVWKIAKDMTEEHGAVTDGRGNDPPSRCADLTERCYTTGSGGEREAR